MNLYCEFLITVLIMMQILSIDARTVNKFKYNKMMMKKSYEKITEENDQIKKCNELPTLILNDILGAAFNSRYMSIDEPKIEDFENDEETPSLKRDAQNFKPFYVDDTYVMELSDKPAWEVTHLTETERNNKREIEERSKNSTERTKRQSNNRRRNEDSATQPQQQKRPWECEAKIKWIDLGYDYYPRYLRTVECTRHACFYGHFTCKPRSFTVKLLRRRRGECVPTRYNIGIENLHEDLRELWVWEERAVNFCCDCAAR